MSSRIVTTVDQWQLPMVKALTIRRFYPELVKEIVATDYVIFVEACNPQNGSRTVQLDPIGGGYPIPRSLIAEGHNCIPLTLLSLSKHLYDQAPQAWLLQVPTKSNQSKSDSE